MKIAARTSLSLLAAAAAASTVGAQDMTIPEAASGVADASTLVGLLAQANLVDTLNGDGPFTVFAPPNSAFAAVDPKVLACVAGNEEWLTGVLTYHVVPGDYPASAVTALTMATDFATVQGEDVVVDPTALTVNTIEITGPDAIVASNGVVHLIDGVLIPPSLLPDITACATATDAPDTPESPDATSGAYNSVASVVGAVLATASAFALLA